MAADMIYMIAVYMGIVHFLEIPIVKSFLWLFGFFVLTYTGIECMVGAGNMDPLSYNRNKESASKVFFCWVCYVPFESINDSFLAWYFRISFS